MSGGDGSASLWDVVREIQRDTAATRQDIGWIRDGLKELKTENEKRNTAQDKRISDLEQDRSRKRGRDGVVTAAIAAFVAFATAFLSGGWLR